MANWEGLNDFDNMIDDLLDFHEDVFDLVEESAYKVEGDAKRNAPVDTGRLKGSIDTEVNRNKSSIHTEVGTDVEYADSVEYGTSKQKAQPFMVPAFDREIRKLEKKLNDKIKGLG